MTTALPIFKTQSVATGAAALAGAAGKRRLMGVLLFGGSANSQVEFKDAATDTGTVLLSVNVLANDTKFMDLISLGGLLFNTGLFVKPAGTGAIAYVWYE